MKAKIVLAIFLSICIIRPCFSQHNVSNSGIQGKVKFLSAGDQYIAAPSHLLDGAVPTANWIWDAGKTNPKNYFLHIRKTFTVDEAAVTAKAYISACSFAELYINGRYVDRVPTNPDPYYQTYEEIDIAPYLKQGSNTIAALAYNTGAGLHHRMDARAGFFFQGSISSTNGKTFNINSDKSWRVAQAIAWDSNTIYRQNDHTIGLRERYDAQLAYIGWEQSSFDDSGWGNAKEIGVPPFEPWNQIVLIKRERLLYEIIKPVDSWKTRGYLVFDFGKELSAFPRFTVTASKAGAEIIMGTAERLDKDRFPLMKDNVDFTDDYICIKGRQSWQPLTWRGFRYLAIKMDEDVSIDEVSAGFRSFPVKRKGSFSCSDQRLNQIWETGRWTLQICAHDTWMDTPWREQTQYIAGDTRYDMHYSAYAFAPDIKLLHDYNILSGAFSQRHSTQGAIRSRYPTGYHLGPTTSTYIPDYQLEWILMLREHFTYYEDDALIKQVFPNLKKLLKYFESHISVERGLVGKVPGWVVLDHPDTYKMDVDGENTAVNCLYYGALNSAAWMATNILKDQRQADEWNQMAGSLKKSIQQYLWSEKYKAFRDGYESSRITQQTQVYALKYSLVPKGETSHVVGFIKGQGRSCEQSFSYWLLNTMFSQGEGQWALDYIRTNWSAQMQRDDFNGAWHEMWDTWGTTSHSWCSGPTALLPGKVLGVEPATPGWKEIKIQPCLYDLEWAEGVVPSVAGDISVKLEKVTRNEKEAGLRIETIIPEHTAAKLYIPTIPSEKFTIYVDDSIVWEKDQFRSTVNQVAFDSASTDIVVLKFKPGKYVINAVDLDVL